MTQTEPLKGTQTMSTETTDRTRSTTAIGIQLALAVPDAFTARGGVVNHEDYANTLADFAVVVEQWARGRSFDNWYDLIDAFADAFAKVYNTLWSGVGPLGYVSAREWHEVLLGALATTPPLEVF